MKLLARFQAILVMLTWGALLACPSIGYSSDPVVPVAAAGQARAVILVPKGSGESTQWAASELQRYLRALSGADVPILPEDQGQSSASDKSWILIGGPTQNQTVKRAVGEGLAGFNGLDGDGFVLKTFHLGTRPVVVAGGNSDAGTMYAIFELVKHLGVTFRLTGDIIPEKRSSLSIPPLDLREKPAIDRRGYLVEASHHPSVTMLSYEDYARLLDQMAKMKSNYLEFWWFAYQPWLRYSYRGEAKRIGDLSTAASGYMNTMYDGYGSRTTDDVVIGKHWFPGTRLAAPELQHVETPDEAFTAAQDLLRRVIDHAHSRHVKVWLVDEMASLPPNLARYTERIGSLPFEGTFGTFAHPLDPVNREIQVNRLKALIDTYPGAEGYFLNFPEVYYALNNKKHRDFFAQQQAAFQGLRPLMVPWRNSRFAGRQAMADSTIGYFDLFKYLLAKRDEIAPKAKIGLMTVGQGYAMPVLDKMLPKDIPFSTFDTGGRCGYGTEDGMPMRYFGGMGQRVRIDTPYLDDDCDILGLQFNVGVYTQVDRIFTDGIKYGLTGVAPWMVQPRGTEANSNFLAEAAWNPGITMEEFYKDYSTRLFGAKAGADMYEAFMTLEKNQAYLAPGTVTAPRAITMPCCGALDEVTRAYEYSMQKNPFDGPTGPEWAAFINDAPLDIVTLEGSIDFLDQALKSMRAAEPEVAPQGKHELAYLICRTKSHRDDMRAQITEHKAFLAFDRAFREKNAVPRAQFVADLEASLQQFAVAHDQAQIATTEYAQIVDYPSDLEGLYHLNVGTVLGFDLVRQFMETIVEFHEGRPYAKHVPFERIFTGQVPIAKYQF